MRPRLRLHLLAAASLVVAIAFIVPALLVADQAPAAAAKAAAGKAPVHAKQVKRLLIRNAMVIYGNAEPPFGPTNIAVEDGLIMRVGGVPRDWVADAEIDATGKYVMPGIVNGHMHLQDERGGIPQPIQYEMNLYLAAGATTIRDVGADWTKTKKWRADSNAHTLSRLAFWRTSASGARRARTPPPSSARASATRRPRGWMVSRRRAWTAICSRPSSTKRTSRTSGRPSTSPSTRPTPGTGPNSA